MIYLYIYLFIYLSIYYLFISITKYKTSLLILCLPLRVRMSTASLLVSIGKYVLSFFCLNICQFLSLTLFVCLMFVCLFACYSAPVIIFGKCLYCCCKFDFVTKSSFSSIITHCVLFHILILPFGENSIY